MYLWPGVIGLEERALDPVLGDLNVSLIHLPADLEYITWPFRDLIILSVNRTLSYKLYTPVFDFLNVFTNLNLLPKLPSYPT